MKKKRAVISNIFCLLWLFFYALIICLSISILRFNNAETKIPYIYVSNIYYTPELGGQVKYVVLLFNQVTEGVIAGVAAEGCPVKVVDVNSAFAGRKGLLLIERHGANPFEVHPTIAGYKVMADTFKKVILQ